MTKSKKPLEAVCSECGEKRQHHAKGMCRSCYQRLYPGNRPIGNCVEGSLCRSGNNGISVTIWARGRCRKCYNAWRNERQKLEEQFL